MVIPCILSLAFLGANLQKLTDFQTNFASCYYHSHCIDDPRSPDQIINAEEHKRSSPLVLLYSYGILLHIIGRKRTCHGSHRVQDHHLIQRNSRSQ